MQKIGFYSGSFDPVTLGHLDIIERSIHLFDKLVIGIGVHHGKAPFFNEQERKDMLCAETQKISADTSKPIEIISFNNLVVDAAREQGAQTIIRGLRDSSDFRYEAQMAGMNKAMSKDIETVFLISSPHLKHIASKFVRQIANLGGDVAPFVPQSVIEHLKHKGVK
ncbi:MAG: pantetheine-phosphate adenylyltransferase [Pseudomonadota bacterium]